MELKLANNTVELASNNNSQFGINEKIFQKVLNDVFIL